MNVADFVSDIEGMEVIGQGQWNKDENISFHNLFHIMGDQMTIIDIKQMTITDIKVQDVISGWQRSKYCLESG